MQWDSSENAGFSKTKPWFYVNPNYKRVNVATEEKDPGTAGWDAIDQEFLRVYPGQTEPKHYGTLVKWIFGGNDPTALGAAAAAEAAQSKCLIYGVDGSPDIKALIAEGKVTGTGAQSPMTIGKTIAELYYKWKAGETVEARYPIATFMINSDNIAEYNNGGWQ